MHQIIWLSNQIDLTCGKTSSPTLYINSGHQQCCRYIIGQNIFKEECISKPEVKQLFILKNKKVGFTYGCLS